MDSLTTNDTVQPRRIGRICAVAAAIYLAGFGSALWAIVSVGEPVGRGLASIGARIANASIDPAIPAASKGLEPMFTVESAEAVEQPPAVTTVRPARPTRPAKPKNH